MARRLGESTTEGALQAVRNQRKVEEGELREGTEKTVQAFTAALLKGLDTPEARAHLESLVDAAVRQSYATSVGAPGTSTQPAAGTGGGGLPSPLEHFIAEVVASFGAQLEEQLRGQLGERGDGPLGQAISAAAARASHGVAAQLRAELATLLPACEGPERAACLEARVTQLSQLAARGVVAAAREEARPLVWAGLFAAGLLVGLVLALLLTTARLGRRVRALEGGR